MIKVIVVGGGWAGCAAAITAKKAGAEVHLYEKTDLLNYFRFPILRPSVLQILL